MVFEKLSTVNLRVHNHHFENKFQKSLLGVNKRLKVEETIGGYSSIVNSILALITHLII